MKTLLKPAAKKIVKKIWSAPLYGNASSYIDSKLANLGAAPEKEAVDKQKFPLILAPSGNGNIGDQAMFDSILANTPGKLRIIVSKPDSFVISAEDRQRVSLICLPSLIRGVPTKRYRELHDFGKLLHQASVFLVPGADTMDGGHPNASLARLSLVKIASGAGVPTSILGFSWAPHVPKSVLSSMQTASLRARLFPRDPLSAERLRASGVSNVTESADLVFSYNEQTEVPEYIRDWIAVRKERGESFAIVNNSGLIRKKFIIDDEYKETIEFLHKNKIKILFLPHVIREPDNDLFACKEIYEKFGNSDDLLVDNLLLPSHIKKITPDALLTITGRMHLAIMSLSHGTMPITMATAGKVEGLYKLFGLKRGVVVPKVGCGPDLLKEVKAVIDENSELSKKIKSSLPQVRALSKLNWAKSKP